MVTHIAINLNLLNIGFLEFLSGYHLALQRQIYVYFVRKKITERQRFAEQDSLGEN